MKAKRSTRSKTLSRRAKTTSRSTRNTKAKKRVLAINKTKKPVIARKKTAMHPAAKPALKPKLAPKSAEPEKLGDNNTPFAALNDEFALANAWEILGDEEYLLDDEVWNTLYHRIKLQLLQASYSFRIETDGLTLSAYAVTPMPAFRSEHEPGYLNTGSFTLLNPELPGIIFDLKVSASDSALLLDWNVRRKDAAVSAGHIALYLDGELVDAMNLVQNRAHLEITREDLGDASFFFLDSDTGRQTKILALNI